MWACSAFEFLHELSLDRRKSGQILSSICILFVRKDFKKRRVVLKYMQMCICILRYRDFYGEYFDIVPEKTDSFDVTKYRMMSSMSRLEAFKLKH